MIASRISLSPQQINRPTPYGYRRTTVTDWRELIPGDQVLLTGPAPQDRYSGRVDDVHEDGTLIWVLLAHAGGRRLFLKSDGHQVLVDPQFPTLS